MRASALFSVALLFTIGCANPVADAAIEALGPEDPAVPQSEIHRPGQPCLMCHGPYKGVEPEMVVAGTIFAYPFDLGAEDGNPIPVEGVTLEISDSFGSTPPTTPKTNCAGNFYITKEEWNPAYPLRVAMRYPVEGDEDGERVSMGTRISRDGSCAGCHEDAPNQGSPGWVYCTQKTADAPVFTKPETCTPTRGD
ncbi:MAG: hypothetical protein IPK82_37300 [Polyangiaceae bacterium]|nr:hypothetical protein [Polyangiaceae bacterium]